jgi:hypothetical protein
MEATTQEMAATDTSAICMAEKLQGRKIGQFGIPNWTIQFPRRQRQHLVTNRGREHQMSLLLITWEVVKRRQGQSINLQPMMK